jgi:cytochrome c oxidase assembly protein subunit 11
VIPMENNAPLNARNRRVALAAATVACAMVGLAYASVPLYKLFCEATGFGGTTQVATAAPGDVANQTITIRFDSNISSSLPWNFHAKQTLQTIRIGEVAMAAFSAQNFAATESTGSATFNVTPVAAGAFFNKIECFCFTVQTLKPGETVEMPVQYFIDPAILQDADAKNIHEITLSYTFYPATKTAAAEKTTN